MGANQSGRMEKTFYGEEVNFDHFQILRAIGKGSFGKVIAAMFFAILLEKNILHLTSQATFNFWKTDFCGYQVEKHIFNRFSLVRKSNYFILTCFAILGIINFPVWGNHDEWMLARTIFNKYFPTCSKILYFFYFSTFPMIAFAAIRLPGILLYGMLQIHTQTILLNHKIIEISENSDHVIDSEGYQNKIHATLCLCIDHHVFLKKWVRTLLQIVQTAMPVFIVLGGLSSIAVLFFVTSTFKTASFVLKMRLVNLAICNILIVYIFSEGGQSFSNETGVIFDMLVTCPWYNWNAKNKQTLIIFMANSLQPMDISLAGITLDYKFALAMFRLSCSYALVLYNFRK